MTILALWERPQADPQYGGTFCLLDDGRLLYLTQELRDDGRNADGSPRDVETGNPHWSPAFQDEARYDLAKADYWMRSFGGRLVRRWKESV